MKKKFVNQVTLEGVLYQHDLEEKVTGPNSKNPGTHYIAGSIDIATDDAMTNVVTVYYTYVTATTSNGGTNRTYGVLENILNGTYKTYMEDPEHAVKLTANTSIGLNEFYTEDKNTGEETLVSQMRNIGGFLGTTTYLNSEERRNEFKCDMVVTKMTYTEANEETGATEKATIGGVIFDFRNQILPVEFTVTDRAGIDYFMNEDISSSNPFVTQVWGPEVNATIVKRTIISSDFGGDEVRETKKYRREFLVTHANKGTLEWGDPSCITPEELTKCMMDRETTLAVLKKRRAEWKANKVKSDMPFGNGSSATTTVSNIGAIPEFKF